MPVIIASSSASTSISETVPASDTLDVPLAIFDDFLKANLEIALFSTSEAKYRGLEATLIKQTSDLSDSIYGKIGDNLKVSLNFLKVGSEVILRLTNTEIFDVSLSVEITFI